MNINYIIEKYNSGISGIEIAKELNVKPYAIYRILNKHNVKTRSNKINSRRFYCNENSFSEINSEESAYWLGFMYADGYVTKNGYVGLSLSIIDKSHLEKFNNFLESNYPVKDYVNNGGHKYSRLLIRSDKLKSDLVRYRCLENKTFLLKFPAIKNELIFHFIRGYFDGDGSLSEHNTNKGLTFRFRLCGTSSFLNSVLKYINFEKSKLCKRHKDRHNDNYDIDIGGNRNVLKIMNFIYDNSTIFLERKYDVYLKLLSRCQEIDNRKSCEFGENHLRMAIPSEASTIEERVTTIPGEGVASSESEAQDILIVDTER